MTASQALPSHTPESLRVVWVPGTDRLLGICHCGAKRQAGDPIEVWQWLHGHPVDHDHGEP